MTMLTMTMKMTIPLLMLLNPPQCCRAVQIEREASTLNPSTFTFENSQTFRCPTTLNLQHWNLSKNTEAQKTKLSSVKTIKAPDRWQKKLNFQFSRALDHAKNVTVCRRKKKFSRKSKQPASHFWVPDCLNGRPFYSSIWKVVIRILGHHCLGAKNASLVTNCDLTKLIIKIKNNWNKFLRH